jgi:hypothetical protein
MWSRIPCGLHVGTSLFSACFYANDEQYTLARDSQANVSHLQRRRGEITVASIHGSSKRFTPSTSARR